MTSNTYDFIPADRVGVLTEEAPQPSPEVLGDESAASCVWSDILKPIASDPMSPVLRYLGTRSYHAATGLELRKTYADGSSTVKTYDAFNRLSTETSARGLVAAYAYETARGLLTGINYSDTTPGIAYSYNHLGALTQVTDAAGTRSLGYNTYGEAETDSLVAGEKTHLITELRDSIGRSVGYTYAKDGAVQQTISTSYGTDGRISGAGFLHGGELKEFTYTYVSGSYLLQGITMPNNMALALSYETQRDLMTGMVYTRGTTTVVQRGYSYDALGRPLTRTQSRQGSTRNDSFMHNDRSELTAATLGTDAYAYAYDNIGNRLTAQEAEEQTVYTANNLNQYTAIQEGTAEAFAPTYDADGNQTLVKTSTGIWSVTYNAANRPVVFANEATGTVVECSYDSSGRRATKKVTVNGTVTLHQRYIYRGYLQIACCDLTRTAHPCLWLITWDPTQTVATRPLAIQKDGTWYTYGLDLTKNVCEVFGTTGFISTAYTYTPYGSVTATGSTTQPIQWSSEYLDTEIRIVCYVYRNYDSMAGRFDTRDNADMREVGAVHSCYHFVSNAPMHRFDYLGGWTLPIHYRIVVESFDKLRDEGQFGNIDSPFVFRMELARGALLPDVPFLSKDSFDLLPFIYNAYLFYSSHFGSRQWWHAMNPGNLSPEQIRENIVERLVKLFRRYRKDCQLNAADLGFSLHMIADSYSYGHAKRNANNEIIEYNNYGNQNKKTEHEPYDRLYPKVNYPQEKYNTNSSEALRIMQDSAFEKAKLATEKIMRAFSDCSLDETGFRKLLVKEILPHANHVK